MCQADVDESGTIDYGEFLAATIHLNKLEREENLVAAFSFFDKDSSGYITIDELQQAWKEFGINDSHLDEMIKDIDQDNVSSSRQRSLLFLDDGAWKNVYGVAFVGWTNRLWRICGNDEERKWQWRRDWPEITEEHSQLWNSSS